MLASLVLSLASFPLPNQISSLQPRMCLNPTGSYDLDFLNWLHFPPSLSLSVSPSLCPGYLPSLGLLLSPPTPLLCFIWPITGHPSASDKNPTRSFLPILRLCELFLRCVSMAPSSCPIIWHMELICLLIYISHQTMSFIRIETMHVGQGERSLSVNTACQICSL